MIARSDRPFGTTSFRLALLFLLLFGAASLLLFGFLYRETNGYLMRMADDWLHREQVGFAQMDEAAFFDRLRAHVVAGLRLPSGRSRLFDASGHWIAGNLTGRVPEPCDGRAAGSPVRFLGARKMSRRWPIGA